MTMILTAPTPTIILVNKLLLLFFVFGAFVSFDTDDLVVVLLYTLSGHG